MTPGRTLASVGVAAATLAYIAASLQGWTAVGYATKPLIVGSCLALVAGGAASPLRGWILAGLALSLGGDVALMLPGDYFVMGLALFLGAHICYIRAFTRDAWRASPLPGLLVGGYLMLVVVLLVPALGPMRLPVVLYATVISVMAWQALERRAALKTPAATLAAFGAVMFVASDTALAVNRFLAPVAAERFLIMGTYAIAQWGIALGMSSDARVPVDSPGDPAGPGPA